MDLPMNIKTIWKSPSGKIEVREFVTGNGERTHDYEMIAWINKKIAIGPQTKENIQNNTKVYRVAKELVHFYGGSAHKKGYIKIVDKKFRDWLINSAPEDTRKIYKDGIRIGLLAIKSHLENRSIPTPLSQIR